MKLKLGVGFYKPQADNLTLETNKSHDTSLFLGVVSAYIFLVLTKTRTFNSLSPLLTTLISLFFSNVVRGVIQAPLGF